MTIGIAGRPSATTIVTGAPATGWTTACAWSLATMIEGRSTGEMDAGTAGTTARARRTLRRVPRIRRCRAGTTTGAMTTAGAGRTGIAEPA
jgi:hypothetical protein